MHTGNLAHRIIVALKRVDLRFEDRDDVRVSGQMQFELVAAFEENVVELSVQITKMLTSLQ